MFKNACFLVEKLVDKLLETILSFARFKQSFIKLNTNAQFDVFYNQQIHRNINRHFNIFLSIQSQVLHILNIYYKNNYELIKKEYLKFF